MANAPKALADFETRSLCSLRKCGSWRYSLYPTTEVLCLAFRLPHWPEGETALWHPAFPHLGIPETHDNEFGRIAEFVDWIIQGELIEAHNAWFERGIWQNILVPRFDWPAVDVAQWRCSAAKCAAHALPSALESAIEALGLPAKKDLDGGKVMKKLTKPRKPRKKERELWIAEHGPDAPFPTYWHESAELFDRLWAYCGFDILAEEGVSACLPDLSPDEERMYLLDQIVNERGFGIDMEAVQAALGLIRKETVVLNRELATLTDGAVQKATQRAQMMKWCKDQGVYLLDTQAATLDQVLENDEETAKADPEELPPWVEALPAKVHKGIQIVRSLGRSSTAKYEAMANWVCEPRQRAHGGLLYHGATTGRWSGAGIQPHNFPKGTLKPWNMDEAWRLLITQDREAIVAKWGSVMEPLAQALRGAIIPSPDHQLYVADFASIEARVLFWMADEREGMDAFRRGEDQYIAMASDIYGRTITKDDKTERGVGKVAILGLGYQMGASKFRDTAKVMAGVEIDDELAKLTVDTYRSKFWRVKRMWYDMEAAAVQAVQDKGQAIACNKVIWCMDGRFLYCELPSGRCIAYPDPKLSPRDTPWGDVKLVLTFMGVNPYNRKWERQTTYGGKIVENVDQAIARDLIAASMMRAEESDTYEPILTVHDELIAEAKIGHGSVHEFEQLVAEVPDWGAGMPVAAEGWVGLRYRK